MRKGPGGDDALIRKALESGLVTPEQVRAALAESSEGESVAQVLLRRRIVGAEDWAKIEESGPGVGAAPRKEVPVPARRYLVGAGMLLLGVALFDLLADVAQDFSVFPPERPPVSAGVKALNDARFVGGAVPRTVRAAQRFRIVVAMRNTGTTSWSRSRGYYLGSEEPRDNQVWGTNRGLMPVGLEVAPGSSCDFAADLVAPAVPGVYAMQWRVLQDKVEWFGEATREARVEVTE